MLVSRVGRALQCGLASAALLALAFPASAQSPIPPVSAGPSALADEVSAAVDAFYRDRKDAPIFLRDAGSIAASRLIVPVLKRAPLDGLAEGPALAAAVEAALDQPGNKRRRLADERMVAGAWVRFVRALRRPNGALLYGDPALLPKTPTAEAVLLEAAGAASLQDHVIAASRGNPLYAELRDAVWAQARLDPAVASDPRVLANLERARLLPSRGRSIVVDSASAMLFMFEDGRAVDRMKVVVGKPDTPTPLLAGSIGYATFNPYWNIPEDVAERVVAPLVLKRGVSYLAEAEYDVTRGWEDSDGPIDPASVDWQAVADGRVKLQLRQRPGPNNIMGTVKFSFPNALGIYLHDTPLKALLDKPQRNFSLGCVRLEDAQRLARWIFADKPVTPSGAPEEHVRVPRPVPVFITYLTLRGDSGRLAMAPDVYGRDGPPAPLAHARADPQAGPAPATLDAAPDK